jgi:hypothetical protein
MKKTLLILAALALALPSLATQITAITNRQVRDPVKLEALLEANFTDAESRLVAAGVTTAAAITLTNTADNGTCSIAANVDKNDDAGDMTTILVPNGGGVIVQTDASSKGTLAAKFTVGPTGILTMLGGTTLDNTASAAELNVTETAVKVTGNASVTGTLGVTGVATFTAAPTLVSTNTPATVTLTMTNAPAACDAGKAAPVYVNVTIGGVGYVIPAWPITP